MRPNADDATLAVGRVIAGQMLPGDEQWIASSFKQWLDYGGELPMPRCFGLPTTPAKLQQLQRNRWLITAWQSIPGDLSPWNRSLALAAEIRHFEAEVWPIWRKSGKPAGASNLRAALFDARCAAGKAMPESTYCIHGICTCHQYK